MNKTLALVKEFHEKFGQPVLERPSVIPEDRSTHRHTLMKDEIEEYRQAVQKGDIENIAKELSDILYTVYGTVLEHGLQDVFDEVFAEVHRSNMSKDPHEYKMIKGEAYTEPNLTKFFSD